MKHPCTCEQKHYSNKPRFVIKITSLMTVIRESHFLVIEY